MGKTPAVTKAEIDRAIEAVTRNGLDVREVLIEPKSVRVIVGNSGHNNRQEPNNKKPKEW